MAGNLDPTSVRNQIAALKAAFPEIEEDEQLFHDMIEAETDAHEFLTVVVDRMQDAAHMAGGIRTYIAQLELRQARFVQREKAMRDLAFKVMEAASMTKAELSIATLSISKGQPRVIITDEAIIPDVLCQIKRTPDKTRIKEMLKAGQIVRGAELSNCVPHLTVNSK